MISGPDASVLAAMVEARHDAGAADRHEDAVSDQAGDGVADQDEDAASSGVAGLDVSVAPEQDEAAPDGASTSPHQLPEDAPAIAADDRAGPDAAGLRRRRSRRRRGRGRARRNPGR